MPRLVSGHHADSCRDDVVRSVLRDEPWISGFREEDVTPRWAGTGVGSTLKPTIDIGHRQTNRQQDGQRELTDDNSTRRKRKKTILRTAQIREEKHLDGAEKLNLLQPR